MPHTRMLAPSLAQPDLFAQGAYRLEIISAREKL